MGQRKKYSDEQLLQELRCEGVDIASYEQLFHRYYPMVFNFVNAMVKNSAVAEDIAQNSFMKLWLNRMSLQPALSVKNYLCVIARNEATNYLRSAQSRNVELAMQQDVQQQEPTAGLMNIISGVLIDGKAIADPVTGELQYDFTYVSIFWVGAAVISFLLPILNWGRKKQEI